MAQRDGALRSCPVVLLFQRAAAAMWSRPGVPAPSTEETGACLILDTHCGSPGEARALQTAGGLITDFDIRAAASAPRQCARARRNLHQVRFRFRLCRLYARRCCIDAEAERETASKSLLIIRASYR